MEGELDPVKQQALIKQLKNQRLSTSSTVAAKGGKKPSEIWNVFLLTVHPSKIK